MVLAFSHPLPTGFLFASVADELHFIQVVPCSGRAMLNFSGFEGALSAPCVGVANAAFFGCSACAMLNFSGFEGALSAPCVGVANAAFFGFPELRFRWCLAFSHPLPTSFIQLVPCSGCAMLNFSGFEGALSAPCVGVVNAAFFGFRELGFRWCLAFSHPLPTGFLFASVADELHFIQVVPCSGRAMLNFSGFEGALSAPCVGVANAAFFGFPELGFRCCLAFSHPLPTSFIQLVPCSLFSLCHA